VRARFATRTTPIVTMSLIFLNVAVYIVCAQLSHNIFEPFNPNNPLYANGAEVGTLILQDPTQAYRIVTAMFLHANYLHILLNMLSLYVIGSITERLYGGRSYLLLYFVSGIIAGLAEAFIQPNAAAVGASGAIFGIFGAFGAYLILRRRELGPVAGPLTSQWVFMLVLNLFISVSVPGIALWDHIGGLVAGFAIGAFLLALQQQRSRG
jgi:membrane associated rhomboid family serine protease